MGDHVKVIGGRFEGDTGLIVRVEGNTVVLFADLTMHEVRTNQSWPAWCAKNNAATQSNLSVDASQDNQWN